MYVCMYIGIYVLTYICIYMYIHIHIYTGLFAPGVAVYKSLKKLFSDAKVYIHICVC